MHASSSWRFIACRRLVSFSLQTLLLSLSLVLSFSKTVFLASSHTHARMNTPLPPPLPFSDNFCGLVHVQSGASDIPQKLFLLLRAKNFFVIELIVKPDNRTPFEDRFEAVSIDQRETVVVAVVEKPSTS